MITLKRGVNGEDTKKLQTFLKELNFYHGSIDGKFGPATENALILFQKANGLKPNGIAGKNTYNKLIELGKLEKQITALESLNISVDEIKKIIYANSHKLVCSPNTYNENAVGFDPDNHLVVVAIRGFKLNSMGAKDVNDRMIYDDAHFIVTPRGMQAYEGNTDPNGFRKGSGFGSGKGMAMLKTGVWFFGKGPHKGSPAFRQCCPFTVTRDGNPPYDHTGFHAINWHSGSNNSTSSLGCQTNKPQNFPTIRDYIYSELETFNNPFLFNDWSQKVRAFPYILIDETKRRQGILTV
jgi:lysozyme